MFLKKNHSKLEALIGMNTEFNGNMSTNGTFRIDGKFIGNITADWVILGNNASVKGNITAKCAIIGGKVEGNVNAEDLVEIKHTGALHGDINTKKLSVAEGGIFEGRSLIQREDSKVIDFKEAASK